AVVESLEFGEPVLSAVSTVTGQPVEPGLWTDPGYWVEQVRKTVRFGDAVVALEGSGISALLELGPDAALTGVAKEVLGSGVTAVAAQRRDRDEVESWLSALARLYVTGTPVQWPCAAAPELELPTYPFQHQRYWPRMPEPAVTLGRYAVTWTPIAETPSGVSEGRWLLVADEAEQDALAPFLARIEDRLDRLTVPTTGADPRDALAAAGTDLAAYDGILARLDLASTIALLQAVPEDAETTKLWAITRGAVRAAPDDCAPDPEQALIWGFGRSAALESPQRWGGLLDLPADAADADDADADDANDRMADLVAQALAGAGGEDQIAVRATGNLGRRLAPVAAPVGEPSWQPRGTILITGGTGALGAQVARRLAAGGAEHLVLAGRRGIDAPGATALRDELTELGATVTVEACDVADPAAVEALVAGLPGTLTAVVHTAGAVRTTGVADLSVADLDEVLSAKVGGARNLDRALGDTPLDAFVLFSSIAGVWGSGGQAGYAAANAYLDALAERRHDQGRAATAIAWGPWTGGGMAAENDAEEYLLRRGLRALDPEAAVDILQAVATGAAATLTVADVDWPRFAATFAYARRSRLLDDIPQAAVPEQPATTGPTAGVAAGLADRLRDLPADRAEQVLVDLVRARAAAILGYGGLAEVPERRAFQEIGVDSLTAVELRDALRAETGLNLPATIVFDHPTPTALARYLRDSLLGGTARQATPDAPVAVDEPVAIVGIGCRYPGGVRGPEDLWRLVAGGEDAVAGFPDDRGWDLDGLYDPDPDQPGGVYVREGAFLDGVAGFDADFFGISPREAVAMDPQQRLLLETAWEAIERAGLDPDDLRGSRTGVFVGANNHDYATLLLDAESMQGHVATGTAGSVLSGRLAYVLGLEGPAITVDTACSSSLVALHMAVQSLQRGECRTALVGGVTIMATPGTYLEFARQRGLAPDGRCKAFADSADGTGWGEGVGMLLVERLSDAQRLGHPIVAVVRGSAINQDGASNGLTAPNGPAQERVIRAALANAGLTPGDVDAVEAHGTGTKLGDPIEAQALLATYGQDRSGDRPLWLGSIKSNIGHTQAAAGVAGIIKMVMAMHAGVLPRTLHVDAPSSHVDWSSGQVQLLTEEREWVGDRPRRAAVSSFGMSGTNAHVVLEQAPAAEQEPAPVEQVSTPGGVVPWVVSGRSVEALGAAVGSLAEWASAGSVDVGAVAAGL
ncbi:SDR family NAD(P)-dependent oxidoreductase, partial [Rugosimonospora acidiphila]|uniref:SDR family NAD(P)-dependent oxidoreductase n=1 Tax=Rugosimonospora acidiphila TaxID=556531 RepID=UPI0031E6E403